MTNSDRLPEINVMTPSEYRNVSFRRTMLEVGLKEAKDYEEFITPYVKKALLINNIK